MTGILLGPRVTSGSVGESGAVALADDSVDIIPARWYIGSDGYTYHHSPNAANRRSPWINPQVGMEQYEVRVTHSGDPLDKDDGTDIWISLAVTSGWGYAALGPAQEGVLEVEIRRASDGVIVDSATINLYSSGTTTTV